jgi:hypothetical protein
LTPNLSSGGLPTLPVAFYDPSPNVRVYLSRTELTQLPQETVHRNEMAHTKLFADVLALPGVAMLVGKPYELVVQKADLWEFDEIHPKVLDFLLAANLIPMTPASDRKQ